jgi:hypothetical protein
VNDESDRPIIMLPPERETASPSARAAGGPEKRMSKAETLSVFLEDPCLERIGEAASGSTTGGGFNQGCRWVCESGNNPRNLEPRRREPVEALVHELVQVRGDRQRLAGGQPAAPSLDRARELECEERISAGRLPDPQERRPGENRADPRSQQFVQGAEAERAELLFPADKVPSADCHVPLHGVYDGGGRLPATATLWPCAGTTSPRSAAR